MFASQGALEVMVVMVLQLYWKDDEDDEDNEGDEGDGDKEDEDNEGDEWEKDNVPGRCEGKVDGAEEKIRDGQTDFEIGLLKTSTIYNEHQKTDFEIGLLKTSTDECAL